MLSRNNLSKFSCVLLLFFLFNFSFCQVEAVIIDDEGWAKGNYIEIGIGKYGAFGAQTANKPINFHDNREIVNNQFGFIANPQKDNWVDYDGDYFTPGIAEEGFTLEINGINYSNNTNAKNVSFDILGKIISANTILSSCYDDYSQLIWEGKINGLTIKRFYNITSNGLFIKMSTFIYNESSEIKKNVFFMHSVDPDNNQVILNPYDFDTDLELISQGHSTNNISFVKASQPPSFNVDDMDGATVSLYAQDSRSRVSYGGFFNRMASDVWNGISFTTIEGSFSTQVDEAISIAFKLGNIAPDENIVFSYYYILEDIDESFDPQPVINISHINPGICKSNIGEILFSGLNPNEAYTIDYKFNQTLISQKTYTTDENGIIIINELIPGIYSDFVFTNSICENTINTQIEIISNINPFDAELKVNSKLFSENNSAEIIVFGDDEYQFKLDDGEFQSSNIFNNISYGLHKFYIRNNDDCQEIVIEKTFFNYKIYFTPNGDNVNDSWQIKSFESIQVLKVLIYNRYGKLLKALKGNDSNSGWDGTCNGEELPTADYWFTLYYLETNTIEKTVHGHFTLKR